MQKGITPYSFIVSEISKHFDGSLSSDFIDSSRLVEIDSDTTSDNRFILVLDGKQGDYTQQENIITSLHRSLMILNSCKGGDNFPNSIIFAGDNEIFGLPTIPFKTYLDDVKYEWTLVDIADLDTSVHSVGMIKLYSDLLADKNVRPYVHSVYNDFDVTSFLVNIEKLVFEDRIVKVNVNEKNLGEIFKDFSVNIIGEDSGLENKTQIVAFISALRGDESLYLHSEKTNVLVMGGKEFNIRSAYAFERFLNKYDANNYSSKELIVISSLADSLITESDRRLSGDFWTPRIWADEAHSVISEQLGDDWKDEYVVWDSAAGGLNLTRDYEFANLYSSTLFSEELAIAEDYNKEANKFQYDFLNDDIELHSLTRVDFENDDSLFSAFKVPEQLLRDLYDNKPMVFFSNPPYGTVSNGTRDSNGSVVIASNSIREHMISSGGQGHAEREMYTQFIYRVQLFAKLFEYKKDFHFFFFNKCFLSTPAYGKFIDNLTKDFTFQRGFMINGGEFDGTSSAWAVIFSHFEIGAETKKQFSFEVLRSIKDRKGNVEIEKFSDWICYRPEPDDTLAYWVKAIKLGEIEEETPFTKNGFDVPNTHIKGKAKKGAFGYGHNQGFNVQYSGKFTGMYTMAFSSGQGYSITPENFERAAITFAIRRSVHENIHKKKQLWVKDKDVFLRPSDDLLTDEFINDCIIYSLFDKQSNQTSLRNYEFKGKKYRIQNEFFPFSKDYIKNLAIKHDNRSIKFDVDRENNIGERFVNNYLMDNRSKISPEAQVVINAAKSLIEDSFHLRNDFAKKYPRYQMNSWDAGWLQVNRMIFGNDRINNDFIDRKEEWRDTVATLGNKIAQAVYNDGMITSPFINGIDDTNTHNIDKVITRVKELEKERLTSDNNDTSVNNGHNLLSGIISTQTHIVPISNHEPVEVKINQPSLF